jgi:hypothetical protein
VAYLFRSLQKMEFRKRRNKALIFFSGEKQIPFDYPYGCAQGFGKIRAGSPRLAPCTE